MRISDMPEMREALKGYTMVECTAAARWFFEEDDRSVWRLRDDFYRLTPPGQATWMEFSGPKHVREGDRVSPWPAEIKQIGAEVFLHDIHPDAGRVPGLLVHYLAQYLVGGWAGISLEATNQERLKVVLKDPPRWILGARIYIAGNGMVVPIETHAIALDDEGRAYPQGTDGAVIHWAPGAGEMLESNPEEQERLERGIGFSIFPFAFALSLLNCRNVKLVEEAATPYSRQQRRTMNREGYTPRPFYWLTVEGLQRQADKDASASGHTGIHKRLHQVRSHWATYTADAPLFGRVVGTFFRPTHVRGTAALGELTKGYQPKAP